MSYEEMSAAEINLSVARLMFVGYEMHIPYKHRNDVHVYHKDGGFVCASPDYCNNPADAWPIIHGNGIGLFEHDVSGVGKTWTATTNLDKSWLGYGTDGFDYTDKNPLRAAMIVFLMMQNVE